jgi:CubicO group peptidase (beta-lactamase class C family)
MPPYWEPGTKMLYQAWTWGFLVGEIVRRITGRTIGAVLHEEISKPLGLNLWLGLPESEEDRVIPFMTKTPLRPVTSAPSGAIDGAASPGPPPFDFSDPLVASFFGPLDNAAVTAFVNTREAHAAQLPASGCIADARSLAKLYASLLGPVDGHPRLLSEETMQRAIAVQTTGIPTVAPFHQSPSIVSLRFGLGYARASLASPMMGESSFGHTGMGGSWGFADIDSGIAVGYVCNNPLWELNGVDERWMPWLEALKKVAKR